MNNNSLAGFFKVDITPAIGIDLEAYNRPTGATGILDNLYAVTMILKTNEEYSVLINIDNVGLDIELTTEIRDLVASELNINKENIMICFTHTHSGPKTVGNDKMVLEYREFLKSQVVNGVKEASSNMKCCQVGWGLTELEIGINRREHVKGKARMGVNPDGVVDKRLGILKVVDAESSELLGIMLRVTAHANVLMADNLEISGDFPTHTRIKLEEELNCHALVTIGASGNINPAYRGTTEDLEKISKEISELTFNKIKEIKTNPLYKLKIQSKYIKSKTVDLPKGKEAFKLSNEVSNVWGVNTDKWLSEVSKLTSNGDSYQTVTYELQSLTINDGIICGVPIEVFTETALKISKTLKNELVFFGGYTNGYSGYLPSLEEFSYGGYEVEWNPVVYGIYFKRLMPLAIDTEQLIISSAIELINR